MRGLVKVEKNETREVLYSSADTRLPETEAKWSVKGVSEVTVINSMIM